MREKSTMGEGVAIENSSSRRPFVTRSRSRTGSSRGVGSSAIAIEQFRLAVIRLVVIARAASARGTPRARGGRAETRRGWTSAPPPPPLGRTRGDRSMTDPPAPPTQDARTTSTLTDLSSLDDGAETTAIAADGRVMEQMERIRTAKRKATEDHGTSRDERRRRRGAIGAVRLCAAPSVDKARTPRSIASGLRRNPRGIDARAPRAGGAASTTTRRDEVGRPPHRSLSRAPGGPGGAPHAVSRSHLGAGGARNPAGRHDEAEA